LQRGTEPPSKLSWDGYKLILSVGEDPFLLYTRYKLLTGAGYAVLSALSGEEAIRLFENNPVDLVVLDFALPDTNGLLLAERMRDSKPEVPTLLLSTPELPEESLYVVSMHLRKSAPNAELLAAIREWIHWSDRNQQGRRAAGM
jgi:DNA-binding response OmpR family regulator